MDNLCCNYVDGNQGEPKKEQRGDIPFFLLGYKPATAMSPPAPTFYNDAIHTNTICTDALGTNSISTHAICTNVLCNNAFSTNAL